MSTQMHWNLFVALRLRSNIMWL